MRNVLAVAWSGDGLLAMITRAAYRGPKNQVHVFDAANGFAPIAKMELPGHPERDRGNLAFVGDRLLGQAGDAVMAWDPRTGKQLMSERLDGWVFSIYADGRAGVNSNGALRLEDPSSGARRRLGFSAERLLPLVDTDDDWATIDDGKIRRVAVAGTVRWEIDAPGRVTELGASATSVAVALNAEKTVHVFDAESGKRTSLVQSADQLQGLGVLRDGTVWVLEWHGRLALHRPSGALIRETKIDALCRYAELSPDETKIAIVHDLLELRSCLRVADMTTGEIVFESSARANKAPAARGGGATVTAKDGKLWKKGDPEALGTYAGEVQVAMAKDGSLALVHDESGVRVFDVTSRKLTIQLSNEKIEEETIDIVDAPLFDAENRPCVKVGKHTFRVEPSGVVAVTKGRGQQKKEAK